MLSYRSMHYTQSPAADNLLAPPAPTFVDRRAAADNLSARRGCRFSVYLFCSNFRSMTKKRSSENFEDRGEFLWKVWKSLLASNAAPPTPILLDRRSRPSPQHKRHGRTRPHNNLYLSPH